MHERIAARRIARRIREGDTAGAARDARTLADALGAVPWRECPPGAWLIVEARARGLADELGTTVAEANAADQASRWPSLPLPDVHGDGLFWHQPTHAYYRCETGEPLPYRGEA